MIGPERLPIPYRFHSSCNFTFFQKAMLNVLLNYSMLDKIMFSSTGEMRNKVAVQTNQLLYKHFILGTGYDSQ